MADVCPDCGKRCKSVKLHKPYCNNGNSQGKDLSIMEDIPIESLKPEEIQTDFKQQIAGQNQQPQENQEAPSQEAAQQGAFGAGMRQDGTGIEGAIARIIFEDVVKQLCDLYQIKNTQGNPMKSWDDVQDKGDYFKVAGKIIEEFKRWQR